MEKEIIEGNKLIAEFMGIHKISRIGCDLFNFPLCERYEEIDEAKYHSSWDWLMAVVEKIESLEEIDRNFRSKDILCTPYRVDILGRNMIEVLSFGEDSICLINQDELTKMEAIYKAVVEFIKWYNEQKSPSQKEGTEK